MKKHKERIHHSDGSEKNLLTVNNLSVNFPIKREGAWFWEPPVYLKAVNQISFYLKAGETLGIVGESGCGKSTLARAIIGLLNEAEGEVLWLGEEDRITDLITLPKNRWNRVRKEMQMIFQDPLASLNPRMTVGDIIAEPLKTHYPSLKRAEIKAKVESIMDRVGLLPNQINRYPHEFSGGQCQRIGIARALILEPKLIICDEPVSALDVSIQAQVINLLRSIQKEMNLGLIFIAHDLAVVKHISDRVMVMYLGNVVEMGDYEAIYHHPKHPYTRALMDAVPVPDPDYSQNRTIDLLEGELPSPIDPPSGCVFRTRCRFATEKCSQIIPTLQGDSQHLVACHYADMEIAESA